MSSTTQNDKPACECPTRKALEEFAAEAYRVYDEWSLQCLGCLAIGSLGKVEHYPSCRFLIARAALSAPCPCVDFREYIAGINRMIPNQSGKGNLLAVKVKRLIDERDSLRAELATARAKVETLEAALRIQAKAWHGVVEREGDGPIVDFAEAQIRRIDAALKEGK